MYEYEPGRHFAAICKGGHVVEGHVIDPDERTYVSSRGLGVVIVQQGRVRPFCPKCSAPVITKCEACGVGLPGYSTNMTGYPVLPVAFCQDCGLPQPWASRRQRIRSLYNLIDYEDDLTEQDRLDVIEAIAVLSEPEDGPKDRRSVAAGQTVRRLAPKAWETAQPVLSATLGAYVKQKLNLP